MWKKLSIFAIALSLIAPPIVLADNKPGKTQAVQTQPKPKPQQKKPQGGADTLQFATGTPLNITGSKATTPEAGQASVSSIKVQNPCTQPNPPRSCKQTKPPH